MRRPNTKPTYIYWLLDARPEKLAAGWPLGEPFYCGKTVKPVQKRLVAHKWNSKHDPAGKVSAAVATCGEHIRIVVVDTIPPDGDWVSAEKRWIKVLRESVPNPCNIAEGGTGIPGYRHSEETKAKIGNAHRGKRLSPEQIEHLRIINTGRPSTEKQKRRTSETHLGTKKSSETLARMRAAQNNRSPEWRTRISEGQRGKHFTEETRAKMRAAKLGKPRAPRRMQANV